MPIRLLMNGSVSYMNYVCKGEVMKKTKLRSAETTDKVEADAIRAFLEESNLEWYSEERDSYMFVNNLYIFHCRLTENQRQVVNDRFGYELFV